MFYASSHYNQINNKKVKRMIKMRTSAGEQDKYLRQILQNSRNQTLHLQHSISNKQNKTALRKQSKRYTDAESDDKSISKLRHAYQNNLNIIDKQNDIFKSTISPRIRLNRNQSQFFQGHQSSVNSKNKVQRIVPPININTNSSKEKDRISNFEIDFHGPDSKASKFSISRCLNKLELYQSKNKTDRNNYGNFSKRIMEKMKSYNNANSRMKSLKQSGKKIIKKTIFYQSATIKGTKQINQDTVKVGDGVWIVCDGHGQNGHDVSWFAANLLFQLYQQKITKQKFSKNMLKQIFIEVQQNLQESQIDINLSGSTCVMVVLVQHKLYCASIGDSVAVVISQNYKCQVISAEHKPCNIQQAKRIQFFGGKIKKTFGKQHLPMSPLRLWGQGNDQWGPGLAISRSFGDKMAQKYGLIYEPQIRQYDLTNSSKFVVIGSDGLFDQVKPIEMANVLSIQSKQQKFESCRILTQIAHSRWIGYSDDISAVVIYL